MTNRQFLTVAFAIIAVLLIALTFELHRRCTEEGYKDCPRIGDHMWPGSKRGREP